MTYPILRECEQTADGYRHTCGELLDAKAVHHPVWWKDWPHGSCAGGGEVDVEMVPYCKKCGPEPSSYGSVIYSNK